MGRGSSGIGGTASEIRSFERKIYQSNTEHSLIVTKDGEKITFGGDEEHVFADRAVLDKMDGATATHNHPSDSTFSFTDVGNGIARGNLKELRVVTKSGEVHSLTNKGATEQQRKSFSAQFYNQFMKAQNNAVRKRSRGENVNIMADMSKYMENWMKNHAQEYGLEYKKGRIGKV